MPTTPDTDTWESALATHDDRVAALGLDIWLGAEPTFTDRRSEAPEWLYLADGGDKAARAGAMLARLASEAGDLVLRTLGRQYAGEPRPRWSVGLYRRREGSIAWVGPPDPLLGGEVSPAGSLTDFAAGLRTAFERRGWSCRSWAGPGPAEHRVVFRFDDLPCPDPEADERLLRARIDAAPIPEVGLVDDLAAEGLHLLVLRGEILEGDDETCLPSLELPAIRDVGQYLGLLEIVGTEAAPDGLRGLVLTGFPPPVDGTVAWMTVTPDPAVVEVNMAPARNAVEFQNWVRSLFQAAESEQLSPCRYHYNGDVTDSGGGGQITFGGPAPETSPFFLRPWLLPNVIRYFNRHPALSYFFTPTCVGSTSQSPRPDERYREAFDELRLALDLLDRQEQASPALIAASLAPFLTDVAGNSHRSEMNVEKLWNPGLPGRGCQGLVEFRAFRMAPTPEALTARALLFRAILAMLARHPDREPLVDWGPLLHQRYALPHYLKEDLQRVLEDLAQAGLGLPEPVPRHLLNDEDRLIAEIELGHARLTLKRALEFWPLAGDSAAAERSPSRLIDSSTQHVELCLREADHTRQGSGRWRLAAAGWRIPARHDPEGHDNLLICGIRYRAFQPWRGLHPGLAPQVPVQLQVSNESSGQCWRITLHEWKPDGGGYEGLPEDIEESRRRRQERVVVEAEAQGSCAEPRDPPSLAVTPYGLDLRACPQIR